MEKDHPKSKSSGIINSHKEPSLTGDNPRFPPEINSQCQGTEYALLNSNLLLKRIIDFLPDPTFAIDNQGKVIFWNQAIANLTRMKAEDIIGEGNYAHSLVFYGERTPALIDTVVRPEIPLKLQYDYLRKKDDLMVGETFCPSIGSYGIFARVAVAPLYDYYGSRVGAIETFHDISDLRHALEALQESEARFRGLAEASPALIFVLQNNCMRYVNPTFLTLIEYSEEESLEIELWELIHPDFRDSVRIKALSWLKGENRFEKQELKLISRSGKEIWVEVYANPIQYEGQPALIGSLFDISERKYYEEALRRSEVLYRTIFETTGTAMMIFDGNMLISLVNNEFERLSGYRKEEIENITKWPVIVHPDDCKRMQDYHKQRRVNPKLTPSNYEFRLLTKDQCVKDIFITVTLIPGTTDSLVSFMDITERKRAEAQVRYLSFNDKLTGLYNRAFFEEELSRLDTERQWPLSLIMGDVNGLKLINDAMGHECGDQLLQKVAEVLQKSCRQEDLIARWGGDEFIILLPKTKVQGARKICERIKENSENIKDFPIPISISLGIASKNNSGQDMQAVIKTAEDKMYRNKLLESKSARSSFLLSLQETLWAKSHETEEHCRRVKELAVLLGEKLDLPESELDDLRLLALLHDVGCVAIPNDILDKPSPLTPREWETVKKHPETGYRIALTLPELAPIAGAILAHHERWDGEGYPLGLRADEIPLISRILAIIDAFEVMTAGRPYKKAISADEAREEIRRCAGSQFDPNLVEIFDSLLLAED